MKYEMKFEKYKAQAGWQENDPQGRVTWQVAKTAEEVFEEDANKLGGEGWQVVSTWPSQTGISVVYQRALPLVVTINPTVMSSEEVEKLKTYLGSQSASAGWRQPLVPAYSCDCAPGTEHCGRNDCTQPYAKK